MQVKAIGPKVLVTGGAGFFGRVLTKRLLDEGLEVRVMDVCTHPALDPRAELVRADLRDEDAVHRAVSGCGTVFHVASLINLALPLGVTVAVLIPLLAGDVLITGARTPAPVLIYAWAALVLAAGVAALWFWRARVEPLIDARTESGGTQAQLTSHLVITWALMEAPALMGVVVFIVNGALWVGVASMLLMWIVALATRPQRAWYERLQT